MLRSLLVVTSSGMVVFSKSFVSSVEHPRLIGSLLTAMMEFGIQGAGLRVANVRFSKLTCSFAVSDEYENLMCAVFHDVEDGEDFGRVIAQEALSVFTKEYLRDMPRPVTTLFWNSHLSQFSEFYGRLPDVFRATVTPILKGAVKHPRLRYAMLVALSSDSGGGGTVIYSTTRDVDQLGFVANLRGLHNLSSDMFIVADTAKEIVLDTQSVRGGRLRKTILRVFFEGEQYALVVGSRSGTEAATVCRKVWDTLQKVFLTLESMQNSLSF